MTAVEKNIRLEFMRYIWSRWLKTAQLAPLMQEKPNVAYSKHLDGNKIAWKCLIKTDNPQAYMMAKDLRAYFAKMVDEFYLLAMDAMQRVVKEYQRLDSLAIEVRCKATPLMVKASEGTISYAESLQLSPYQLKYNELYAQAQKCAYVLGWVKFELKDVYQRGDCIVFELDT